MIRLGVSVNLTARIRSAVKVTVCYDVLETQKRDICRSLHNKQAYVIIGSVILNRKLLQSIELQYKTASREHRYYNAKLLCNRSESVCGEQINAGKTNAPVSARFPDTVIRLLCTRIGTKQ